MNYEDIISIEVQFENGDVITGDYYWYRDDVINKLLNGSFYESSAKARERDYILLAKKDMLTSRDSLIKFVPVPGTLLKLETYYQNHSLVESKES